MIDWPIAELLPHAGDMILLDAVEVWDVPDAPSHLRVEIQYRLARTGAPGRMNVNVQLEN